MNVTQRESDVGIVGSNRIKETHRVFTWSAEDYILLIY